ncbi:hypothetical protein [Clostridium sartagoforme]|uniref:hypothetical protein n=1 Tax=Clostridium sartagoforme TaxID=84031 RepID=UPI0012F78A34|nr:hypothetical protein [Clostridium sartagoforme]
MNNFHNSESNEELLHLVYKGIDIIFWRLGACDGAKNIISIPFLFYKRNKKINIVVRN